MMQRNRIINRTADLLFFHRPDHGITPPACNAGRELIEDMPSIWQHSGQFDGIRQTIAQKSVPDIAQHCECAQLSRHPDDAV
jgi:hypothetical protein